MRNSGLSLLRRPVSISCVDGSNRPVPSQGLAVEMEALVTTYYGPQTAPPAAGWLRTKNKDY